MAGPLHATTFERNEAGRWVQTMEDPEVVIEGSGPWVTLQLGHQLYELWPDEAEQFAAQLHSAVV